jgi:hypothetical protein
MRAAGPLLRLQLWLQGCAEQAQVRWNLLY